MDNSEGEILDDYKPLGVYFFPMYILIDPEGNIVSNDAVGPKVSLRQKKLELIHDAILSWDWETSAAER